MNPLKWIFGFVKYTFLDIWEDIKFIFVIIKKLKNKEPLVNKEKWEAYKQVTLSSLSDPKQFFAETWYWIIVILFALALGFLLSAKYYQMECNNLIVDKYINNIDYNRRVDYSINQSSPILPFIPQMPNSPAHEQT